MLFFPLSLLYTNICVDRGRERERQKKGAKGFLNCGEDLSGGQDEAVLRFPFVHEVAVDQHG